MNVCLISREFPPFFGGGIGTYSEKWSRALAGAGHRVVVATVSDDGTEKRDESGGVMIVRLPFIQGQDWSGPHPAIATPETRAAFRAFSPVSVFAMQVAGAMPRLVREFSIEVIEAPDTGALAWFGLNSRRTGGAWRDMPPVVTVIHSPTVWIHEQNRAPLRGRRDHELTAMERDSARWSDGLVCPSAYLAEWSARQWGVPRAAIETIPYPLGDLEVTARAAAGERTVRRTADDPFVMLFAGRLEPRKGVDTLLAGFARVARALPGLRLELAGEDMPDPSGSGRFGQNSFLSQVPDDLRARVRLLGRKTPEELGALRERCDAVVIPSAADNFPFSCVEAMAEGRVVIASSGGGTGEMIRPGVDGFLFDAGDAESCAAAIRRAAASSGDELTRIARGAASRMLAMCGNEAVVARRVAHFERVRAKAKPGAASRVAVLVVNKAPGSPAAMSRLEAAVQQNAGDVDFAHGWARTPDGAPHVWGTPDVLGLSLGTRVVGPVVMSHEAARHPAVVPLLRELQEEHGRTRFQTDSTWTLVMAMAAAGLRGAVVPDAVLDVPDAERHPADMPMVRAMEECEAARRGLEHQLEVIHGSRGWRFLQRVYDVLHFLRGRGFRRPDYHE